MDNTSFAYIPEIYENDDTGSIKIELDDDTEPLEESLTHLFNNMDSTGLIGLSNAGASRELQNIIENSSSTLDLNGIACESNEEEDEDISMDDSEIRILLDETGRRIDLFCWKCHKITNESNNRISCTTCPRSFHRGCLKIKKTQPANNWICFECIQCTEESNLTKSLLDGNTTIILSILLGSLSTKGSVLLNSINVEKNDEYEKYIVNPICLKKIANKIDEKKYKDSRSFFLDLQWINHNFHVYNEGNESLPKISRQILKKAKDLLQQFELCDECYNNFCVHGNAKFSNVCEKRPHLLLWAQAKGYPYWPAKLMAVSSSTGSAYVKFFGDYSQLWISYEKLYLFSENHPSGDHPIKVKGYKDALKEVQYHIGFIKRHFGRFQYAQSKNRFNVFKETEYLKNMIPILKTKMIEPCKQLQEKKQHSRLSDVNKSMDIASSVTKPSAVNEEMNQNTQIISHNQSMVKHNGMKYAKTYTNKRKSILTETSNKKQKVVSYNNSNPINITDHNIANQILLPNSPKGNNNKSPVKNNCSTTNLKSLFSKETSKATKDNIRKTISKDILIKEPKVSLVKCDQVNIQKMNSEKANNSKQIEHTILKLQQNGSLFIKSPQINKKQTSDTNMTTIEPIQINSNYVEPSPSLNNTQKQGLPKNPPGTKSVLIFIANRCDQNSQQKPSNSKAISNNIEPRKNVVSMETTPTSNNLSNSNENAEEERVEELPEFPSIQHTNRILARILPQNVESSPPATTSMAPPQLHPISQTPINLFEGMSANQVQLPGSAGPIHNFLEANSAQLAATFNKMFVNMIMSPIIQTTAPEMLTFKQERQIEKLTWENKQLKSQIEELTKKYDTSFMKNRRQFELKLEETKKKFELDIENLKIENSKLHKDKTEIEKRAKAAILQTERIIEDVKLKKWCVFCHEEAVYYCCCNACYCSVKCAVSHQPQHITSCKKGDANTQGDILFNLCPIT